jgi:RNA polymerase sigma factor (sigma-70 family)
MEQEISFETLFEKHRIVVERYINFRLPNIYDADDVIQETFCAAYVVYDKLQSKELFKPWLLSIAKNQSNMWFRKRFPQPLFFVFTDVMGEGVHLISKSHKSFNAICY